MALAALATWLTTAMGGLYLLITWLVRGGLRQQRGKRTNFPTPLILGHFLLAASGLGMWIVYVLADGRAFAWAAFGTLLLVVLLGFTMFARWGAPIHDSASSMTGSAGGAQMGTPAVGLPTSARPAAGSPAMGRQAMGRQATGRQPGGSPAARMPAARMPAARMPAAGRQPAGGASARRQGTAVQASTEPESPAESHFPILIVAAHGAFAATTLILVFLNVLGVGGT